MLLVRLAADRPFCLYSQQPISHAACTASGQCHARHRRLTAKLPVTPIAVRQSSDGYRSFEVSRRHMPRFIRRC